MRIWIGCDNSSDTPGTAALTFSSIALEMPAWVLAVFHSACGFRIT